MKKGTWFVLLLSIILIHTTVAQMTEDEQVQRLEELIEQQQQQIQGLQQRLQALEEEPVTAQPASTTTQGGNYTEELVKEYIAGPEAQDDGAEFGYEGGRGFFIRVPNFELYMSGSVQMGLAVFENDTPDDNSIYPNGVVLMTDVYLYNDWHGRIELNFHQFANNMFQGPTFAEGVQLWDAWVEYLGMKDDFGNPMVALRVGQTHVPFTIEGQWNPDGGVSIWAEPFTSSWGHGRDPGIMLWGVLSDMVEYKLSVHNGEGRTTTNATDDFLFAGCIRLYPFKKSENKDVFVHIGAIRSRDNRVHAAGIGSAQLATPWFRTVFDPIARIDTNGDGLVDTGTDGGQGWTTGVDAGISAQMDFGDDKLYVEGEFMYITWERDFASGRLPFLEGFGGFIAFSYRHNLTPDVPGAGIYPLFKFSYADIDNKDTDSVRNGGQIRGQRIWCYTAGLGYAFNDHIRAEFNWVVLNLDEPDIYNGAGNSAKDDRADGSDDWENAWFLQFTANW
jgi:hypothetical protein